MSLEHLVINTLEELEVICKYKNSVRITYTNVFSHLRSRDRKLRIFSKPELNITSPFFQKKSKATLNLKLTFATITEVSGLLNNNEITEKIKNRSAQLMKMISTVLKF